MHKRNTMNHVHGHSGLVHEHVELDGKDFDRNIQTFAELQKFHDLVNGKPSLGHDYQFRLVFPDTLAKFSEYAIQGIKRVNGDSRDDGNAVRLHFFQEPIDEISILISTHEHCSAPVNLESRSDDAYEIIHQRPEPDTKERIKHNDCNKETAGMEDVSAQVEICIKDCQCDYIGDDDVPCHWSLPNESSRSIKIAERVQYAYRDGEKQDDPGGADYVEGLVHIAGDFWCSHSKQMVKRIEESVPKSTVEAEQQDRIVSRHNCGEVRQKMKQPEMLDLSGIQHGRRIATGGIPKQGISTPDSG